MKYRLFLVFLIFIPAIACRDNSAEQHHSAEDTIAVHDDHHTPDTVDIFSGGRFRNVKVERTGDTTFQVTGEAQVFEAAFSWVIEDGHNEIKQGYGTTDAGAPAWGKFSFDIGVQKLDPNTVLHLILFEASAKDGSRQHELPVLLY